MCVLMPEASAGDSRRQQGGGLEAANWEGRPAGTSKVMSFPGVHGRGAWQGGPAGRLAGPGNSGLTGRAASQLQLPC